MELIAVMHVSHYSLMMVQIFLIVWVMKHLCQLLSTSLLFSTWCSTSAMNKVTGQVLEI